MSTQLRHSGACFCGSVSYTVTGKPKLSAFCHCTRCQRLSGSTFIWTIHFPAPAFTWTHLEPHTAALDSYVTDGKPWKTRYRCKRCGVCVASHNTQTDNVSVWGVHLERDENGVTKDLDSIKPTAHTFYATRILDVGDNLGKWEGLEGSSTRM
ncbi:Mss4-like protein [Favolaschia claudopus]|uniref:Mss4-like protein n=1 Tax=Favolaschia claudopus TaxID=2862362 RepID=A0AAW0EDZ6_9AGAR